MVAGAHVVGGGRAYRFAPPWPQLDLLQPKQQLQASQFDFLAMDLRRADAFPRSVGS